MVGLNPSEVWDLTLADFNYYLMGYGERMGMEQENLIIHAHTSANFIGASMGGKLKKLDHYLPKKHVESKPFDGAVAREFSRKIEEAKRR